MILIGVKAFIISCNCVFLVKMQIVNTIHVQQISDFLSALSLLVNCNVHLIIVALQGQIHKYKEGRGSRVTKGGVCVQIFCYTPHVRSLTLQSQIYHT